MCIRDSNRFIRPNMVVACGLNYTMLDEEQLIACLLYTSRCV